MENNCCLGKAGAAKILPDALARHAEDVCRIASVTNVHPGFRSSASCSYCHYFQSYPYPRKYVYIYLFYIMQYNQNEMSTPSEVIGDPALQRTRTSATEKVKSLQHNPKNYRNGKRPWDPTTTTTKPARLNPLTYGKSLG